MRSLKSVSTPIEKKEGKSAFEGRKIENLGVVCIRADHYQISKKKDQDQRCRKRGEVLQKKMQNITTRREIDPFLSEKILRAIPYNEPKNQGLNQGRTHIILRKKKGGSGSMAREKKSLTMRHAERN